MNSLATILFLVFVGVVSCHHGMDGGEGGFGHGFNPFGFLERNLTQEQRSQVQAIVTNNALTKGEQQTQLSQLFTTFGLGDQFQAMVAKKDAMLANATATLSSSNLSSEARTVAQNILSVVQNQAITAEATKTQIEQILSSTTEAIKQELKQFKSQFMGGHHGGMGEHHKMNNRGSGHHGHGRRGGFGPLGFLTRNLTEEQRDQVEAVYNNTSLTKQQINTQLATAFENFGLSQQYQDFVNKKNAMIANMTATAQQLSGNLSQEAQNVINQAIALVQNQGITPADERAQFGALFNGTSDAVKQEIKSALRGFIAGHMGGGFGSFGGHHGSFGRSSEENEGGRGRQGGNRQGGRWNRGGNRSRRSTAVPGVPAINVQ